MRVAPFASIARIGITIALDVVFAAAVLLFAIGLSEQASVVARRPLGVAALVVVALWPLVLHLAQPLLPTMDAATFEAGLDAYRAAEGVLTTIFFVNLLVSLAAALIAVFQIARAEIIPKPWQWATVGASRLGRRRSAPSTAFRFRRTRRRPERRRGGVLLGALGFLSRTLGLGIVALVLASRVRSGDVDVFRSA